MAAASTPRVSVVIPTLNARPYLPALLQAFRHQRPAAPSEIIIVDSGSRDGTVEHVAGMEGVRVVMIERFTHGGSRNLGVRESRGEFVAFLSQDALPADDYWLRELLAPFADSDVAAAFSRQTPRPDASPMERYFLETHFPAGDPVFMRFRGVGQPVFQQDVFFSNVSAAVRREAALRHPFDEELIMSEDQQLARDFLLAGQAVAYAPASVVLHSHNYTLRQAFERYFDSVYSLTKIFPRHDMGSSVSLGAGYLRREAAMMVRRHPGHLPRYAGYVLAKSLGTLLGHWAERMPRSWARRMSMHKAWWDRRENGTGGGKIR